MLDAQEPTDAPVVDEVPHTLMGELRDLGLVGQAWTLGVVAFCAIRAIIVWPMLIDHDVNPWWFLVLDVGTSPTYGLGQAMGVKLLRDDRRPVRDAIPWIAMLFISFLAPYVYLLASAGKFPGYVVALILAYLVLFGGLAGAKMARDVRVGTAAG